MSITDNDVEVYDNTFTFDNCVKMIKLFSSFKDRKTKLHCYFVRPDKNDNKSLSEKYNNPFEYMIDDYLTKIGDTSPMVEYWYRDKWFNIPCHQDLNEYCVEHLDEVINPNNGHIMYLSDNTNQAATILFNVDMTAVTLIYPKVGRTVRFNGKSHHAVPNKLSRLFNNDNEEPLKNKFRHVLLFNTWNNYIPDPIETIMKCRIRNTLRFNPKNEWIKLPLFDKIPLNSHDFTMKLVYMGNSMRRFGLNKICKFFVDRRISEDGYHQRMISYEVSHIKNDENLEE